MYVLSNLPTNDVSNAVHDVAFLFRVDQMRQQIKSWPAIRMQLRFHTSAMLKKTSRSSGLFLWNHTEDGNQEQGSLLGCKVQAALTGSAVVSWGQAW